MRQRGICDAWEGETRLESECNPGDGLTLLFRTQSCVPEDMLMYATQTTHCLATWNEGHHTFTVIRHDLFHYTWLLRFPATQSSSFTSYLFKDLFADPTDIITETYNYLRFDTTRDSGRNSGDLCYDDYERCTVMRPRCSGGHQPAKAALACPLACGLCRASSPQWCRLKPEWIGKWDAEGRTNNRSNGVTINGTTMILHSHHHSQNLRCVQWQPDNRDNINNSSNNSAMFVTEFANGCRPRYTCARIENPTASTLNVTLSKTVAWPFIQNPGDPLDCSAFGFKPRTPLEINRTRILLLHARASQHPVNCNLPFRSSNAQIRFSNATTCNGRLSEAKGRRAVELSLRGCSASDVLTNHVFSCLESSHFPPDDDLIITMRTNLSNSVEIYCLVFPTADETAFHLLSGSDACQQVYERETSLDRLHLLRGTLSGTTYRSTTSRATTAQETPQTDSHSKPDVSTSETDTRNPSESVSRTSVPTPTPATPVGGDTPSEGLSRPDDRTDRDTTAAFEPTTPLPTEHPFVVGFAAVLFGIIQGVIYLCRCF